MIKSVIIGGSYGQEFSILFFDSRCIGQCLTTTTTTITDAGLSSRVVRRPTAV